MRPLTDARPVDAFRCPRPILLLGLLLGALLGPLGCGDDGPPAKPPTPAGSRTNSGVSGDPKPKFETDAEVRAEAKRRIFAEVDAMQRELDPFGLRVDPWSLAHALLATDSELRRASLTRDLVTWISTSNGARVPLHSEKLPRGEQHPHLVWKALEEVSLERGPPLDAPLAELSATARHSFLFPSDFRQWNDVAWFLHALSSQTRRDAGAPLALGTDPGAPDAPTPASLARAALGWVESADRVVEEALAAEGLFERPSGNAPFAEAGIYATTCGGQHLLQAVLAARAAGFLTGEEDARIARRVEVLIARLDAEDHFRRREEERALAAGHSKTRASRFRVLTSLKLHGHACETLAAALPLFPPGSEFRPRVREALEKAIERTVSLLRTDLTVLDPQGTIALRLREKEPSMWELWFGDTCHALHGLRLAENALAGE